MVKIVSIDEKHSEDLNHFLEKAGRSLETFRYFNTRDITSLNSHLTTLLAYLGSEPVGYGHLDRDSDNIWLGVAVSEKLQGKGVGKLIMKSLLSFADDYDIAIVSLTVDINNEGAINLYRKFGFVIKETQNKTRYLMQRSKYE
jgi:GNAT superfamily N-acetyltransferase